MWPPRTGSAHSSQAGGLWRKCGARCVGVLTVHGGTDLLCFGFVMSKINDSAQRSSAPPRTQYNTVWCMSVFLLIG